MAQQKFRLTLKSGPDNIRSFPETTTMTFKRGELVKLTGNTTAVSITTAVATSASTDMLGVAAKDGQNTTTPPEEAEVYVVTPEQVWELHVEANVKPNTAFTLGDAYKVKYTSNSNFTMTREAETATTQVDMRGPILMTSIATTDSQGLVLLGYDDATKGKKGQKVLVRFAPGACQALTGKSS